MSEPRIVRFATRAERRLRGRAIFIEGEPTYDGQAQLKVRSRHPGELNLRIRSEYLGLRATKADVDKHVRRIRPDDLAVLRDADARIRAAEQELWQLRRERVDLLHDAFQRGHKVTVKELVDEAREAEGR